MEGLLDTYMCRSCPIHRSPIARRPRSAIGNRMTNAGPSLALLSSERKRFQSTHSQLNRHTQVGKPRRNRGCTCAGICRQVADWQHPARATTCTHYYIRTCRGLRQNGRGAPPTEQVALSSFALQNFSAWGTDVACICLFHSSSFIPPSPSNIRDPSARHAHLLWLHTYLAFTVLMTLSELGKRPIVHMA